jgi:hypothetical protein
VVPPAARRSPTRRRRFVAGPVRIVVDTMNHYRQPVRWSAIADVPVTDVRNLLDRPVPLELQTAMLERLPNPVDVVDLDSGHIPRSPSRRWPT